MGQKGPPLGELSDEKLFEAHRTGDSAALRTLIERHQGDLFRFLFRLSGDRHIAEDAFQEAFLQVHLSADRFDITRRFRPWLFTIAANKARDLLRKKVRRSELPLSAPVGTSDGRVTFADLMALDEPGPEAALATEERDQMVQRAIDRLPWSLREILLLAYFQRLSYAQIADDLGIPLGTVKSRLHAAVGGFAKHWAAVQRESESSGTEPGRGPGDER